jgi:hypothetical protein
MKSTLSVLHPAVESTAGAPVKVETTGKGLAPRFAREQGLRGRRVALLENTKVNAAELLQTLGKRLQAQGVGEVRMWRKRHAGESGAVAIAELLKWKPDLVLTGLGD